MTPLYLIGKADALRTNQWDQVTNSLEVLAKVRAEAEAAGRTIMVKEIKA